MIWEKSTFLLRLHDELCAPPLLLPGVWSPFSCGSSSPMDLFGSPSLFRLSNLDRNQLWASSRFSDIWVWDQAWCQENSNSVQLHSPVRGYLGVHALQTEIQSKIINDQARRWWRWESRTNDWVVEGEITCCDSRLTSFIFCSAWSLASCSFLMLSSSLCSDKHRNTHMQTINRHGCLSICHQSQEVKEIKLSHLKTLN